MRPASRSRADRVGGGFGVEPEAVVGRKDDERFGGKPELVEGPADREVGLVGRVDPDAVQLAAAWRPRRSAQPREVDVASQRHREEVGHDAAGGEQPEAARAVADEVAQPADHLLLDERSRRTGMPDVDALLGDLGEQLADDGQQERRRREVAERARMMGVELMRGETGPELVEDRRGGRRLRPALARVRPSVRRRTLAALRSRCLRPSPGRTHGRRGSPGRPPRPRHRGARAPGGRKDRRSRAALARGARRTDRRGVVGGMPGWYVGRRRPRGLRATMGIRT